MISKSLKTETQPSQGDPQWSIKTPFPSFMTLFVNCPRKLTFTITMMIFFALDPTISVLRISADILKENSVEPPSIYRHVIERY